MELRTPNLEVQMFSALLRYLYTGDICPHDAALEANLLRRLSEEFGTPNPLEHDLRYLLDTGDYADAALVFTSDSDYQRPDSGSSEYGFRPKLELPCHKAILSARSPFFRNLIQRRTRSGEDHTERALHIPTRIVLDESVIPKRYARVLLHAVYLDTVDLSLIMRGNGCGNSAGSLGEVIMLFPIYLFEAAALFINYYLLINFRRDDLLFTCKLFLSICLFSGTGSYSYWTCSTKPLRRSNGIVPNRPIFGARYIVTGL